MFARRFSLSQVLEPGCFRLLKTVAKEMLTVVDRPLIDYVVREAKDAGIEHFIFVTGRGKGAMEDYFDHHVELEASLKSKGKDALAELSSCLTCRSRAKSATSARWRPTA